MRQVPTNERAVTGENGGFSIHWQNFFADLGNAKITEDFSSLPTLDGTSTLDDLRTYLIALDAILKA